MKRLNDCDFWQMFGWFWRLLFLTYRCHSLFRRYFLQIVHEVGASGHVREPDIVGGRSV